MSFCVICGCEDRHNMCGNCLKLCATGSSVENILDAKVKILEDEIREIIKERDEYIKALFHLDKCEKEDVAIIGVLYRKRCEISKEIDRIIKNRYYL